MPLKDFLSLRYHRHNTWAGRSGIKMNYNRRMYEGLRERISNEIFGIRLEAGRLGV